MVSTITAGQLAGVLSNPHADLIDVRDYAEWANGHVDGARCVPLDDLRADPDRVLSRDSVLVFICAKGARSLTAAKLVERLGYATVYNVEGGTAAWARAGLPLSAARISA